MSDKEHVVNEQLLNTINECISITEKDVKFYNSVSKMFTILWALSFGSSLLFLMLHICGVKISIGSDLDITRPLIILIVTLFILPLCILFLKSSKLIISFAGSKGEMYKLKKKEIEEGHLEATESIRLAELEMWYRAIFKEHVKYVTTQAKTTISTVRDV